MGVLPISELFGTETRNCAYLNMHTAPAKSASGGEAEIISSHDGLMRYHARPFVQRGVRMDDLMQEGSIALLGATRSWQASRGVQLWTYARKFVLGAFFRHATRETTEPASAGLRDGLATRAAAPDGSADEGHIESYIENIEADTATPEDELENVELVAVAARELSFLNENERRVIRMRFGDELDVRAIAEILNKSKSDVDRIYHGAIAKLRERVRARL